MSFVIQKPGTLKAEIFVQNLFDQSSGIETIDCEVVANGYHTGVDICLLRVKGGYRSTHYLRLAQRDIVSGNALDVIGYPGDYPDNYIRRMHGTPNRVGRNEIGNISELFPKCELIVSHGKADTGGPTPSYLLSTVVGMSGSPVIMSGKVIGIMPYIICN